MFGYIIIYIYNSYLLYDIYLYVCIYKYIPAYRLYRGLKKAGGFFAEQSTC